MAVIMNNLLIYLFIYFFCYEAFQSGRNLWTFKKNELPTFSRNSSDIKAKTASFLE